MTVRQTASAIALGLFLSAPGALAPAAVSAAADLPVSVGPTYWQQGKLQVKTLVAHDRPVGYCLIVPPGVPVHPALAPRVERLSALAGQQRALVAINGGFFNRSDGEPAAYLVRDGKTLADPHRDRALVGNPQLEPYLSRIFDRPEWRIWKTPLGTTMMAIEPHDEGPSPGWKLLDALQAGPTLLPEIRLEQEGFARKGGDAIDSAGAEGRSAVGLGPEGSLILVCMPEGRSGGLTIPQLRDLMIALGARKAMALDGGTAAAMVARPDVRGAPWWGYDARVRSAIVVGSSR